MHKRAVRQVSRLIVVFILANAALAALNAFGVLPAATWRWVVVLCQFGTAFWAGIALLFMMLNDHLEADLRAARGQARALRAAAPNPHVVCGWCEFTGHPLEVLTHEAAVHGA